MLHLVDVDLAIVDVVEQGGIPDRLKMLIGRIDLQRLSAVLSQDGYARLPEGFDSLFLFLKTSGFQEQQQMFFHSHYVFERVCEIDFRGSPAKSEGSRAVSGVYLCIYADAL